jgi:hypothetical protein
MFPDPPANGLARGPPTARADPAQRLLKFPHAYRGAHFVQRPDTGHHGQDTCRGMKNVFGILLQIIGALLTGAASLTLLFVAATWFSSPWHHHYLLWGLLVLPGVMVTIWGRFLSGEFDPPPPSPKPRDWLNN